MPLFLDANTSILPEKDHPIHLSITYLQTRVLIVSIVLIKNQTPGEKHKSFKYIFTMIISKIKYPHVLFVMHNDYTRYKEELL